jgi:acetyl esterase/lipase
MRHPSSFAVHDLVVVLVTLIWSAWPLWGADLPVGVNLWPGEAPEERGGIGTERTRFERRTYEPRDAVDQISCRPDFAIAVYSGYLKAKDKDELAPGLSVPAGTPPVFLAHGGEDVISPPEHSVLMYLALRRAGVPAELHVYAGAAHDFGVRASDQPCSTWTDSCVQWLRHQGFLDAPRNP